MASVDLGAPSNVTALQLDSDGAMFAVALDIGTLAVWNFDSLRQGSGFPSNEIGRHDGSLPCMPLHATYSDSRTEARALTCEHLKTDAVMAAL